MRHAFLITAYTDAKQLKNLVNTLDSEKSNFFIHIDHKSKLGDSDEITELRAKKNVALISNPIKVYWGGYSHLKAILLLLEEAAKDNSIDYFHALSGQDLPLISINKIHDYFLENNGKEFMSFAKLDEMNWSGGSYSRLQFYHLNDWFNIRVRFWKRINGRFLQLQRILKIRRKLPGNFDTWYGGGTWWSLSKKAASQILTTIRNNPKLLPAFRFTHCSEEVFFQTVLLNSPSKDSVINDDLRYVDWSTRDGHCPVVLDERDLPSIKRSKKIFGRKFVSGISDELRRQLDHDV